MHNFLGKKVCVLCVCGVPTKSIGKDAELFGLIKVLLEQKFVSLSNCNLSAIYRGNESGLGNTPGGSPAMVYVTWFYSNGHYGQSRAMPFAAGIGGHQP